MKNLILAIALGLLTAACAGSPTMSPAQGGYYPYGQVANCGPIRGAGPSSYAPCGHPDAFYREVVSGPRLQLHGNANARGFNGTSSSWYYTQGSSNIKPPYYVDYRKERK